MEIDECQFPEVADNRWNSNWLIVRRHIHCPGGEWTLRDPCLTTFEVAELADWFDSIAGGKPTSARCTFVEPNLAFEYRPDASGALVACFAHESAPPWQLGDERFDGFAISFPHDLNDLAKAAGDLRQLLLKYPE